MKIRLTKGHPARRVWDTVCPICGINNLIAFKNAWFVDGFETEPTSHRGARGIVLVGSRIVKSVNIWTCSKPCAEMALLQNI
jgi:hypothetical protein